MRKVGSDQVEWQGRHWQKGYIKIGYIAAEDLALAPKTGYVHVYSKDSDSPTKLYWKDDADVEHEVGSGGGVTDHGALTGLADDDHPQYRLESEDHTHQSTGLQGGQLDHGLALSGLSDDDHPQYVLRSILTTNGDLFIRSAGAVGRLGIGTDGQVLTVVSGAPAWATPAASGGAGSAWSALTNGDPVAPELMWDSNGDVMMTELLR